MTGINGVQPLIFPPALPAGRTKVKNSIMKPEKYL
jgi:hypothetical protein